MKKKSYALINHFFIGLILTLGILNVSGQTESYGNKWGILIEPYILIPNMNGELGIKNLPDVDVNASPGDIFSKLQFGGMLYLEASNNEWAITSDILYMNLKQDVTTGKLITSGSADAKQFAWEITGLYRLLPYLEAGIGGRLNNIQSSLEIYRKEISAGTKYNEGSLSETWLDPIIIVRATGDIDDKWLFKFRGDIGGFGIGSDFSWQTQGSAGYRFSKLFHLTAGYRILGMKYEKGSRQNRFMYDMNIFGPEIKLGFNL